MTHPTFEILPDADLPPDLAALLDRYDAESFANSPTSNRYQWSNAQWRLIVRAGDEIAAQLGLLERDCRVGGQAVRLGGIGGVMTRPAFRGQGLATLAMTAAVEFLRDERPVDFGMLVCLPHLVPFYAGLGWQVVTGPIWIEQPLRGTITLDEDVPMIMPLRDHVVWPGGPIELLGLPW